MDKPLSSQYSSAAEEEEYSQATPCSSPRRLSNTEALDTKATTSQDFKLYSKMIHRIARAMNFQVQQSATAESCKFFGHLDKAQTPPLHMGFIPSLLDRIKSKWPNLPLPRCYQGTLTTCIARKANLLPSCLSIPSQTH
ncbi:hypothetical protein JRQ81_010903 [Phrynocephalus forsythii]|uniref:Uncharacterized protein n=1 Tax=Phrynocephalus forsythii TaxID=171643 RepID=A0A9Q0X969_9SAUR|nr:hypothetical protein JRQ81_010903 [Phrynocephalus forsythii]